MLNWKDLQWVILNSEQICIWMHPQHTMTTAGSMLQVWTVMQFLCFSVHWGQPGSQLGLPVIVLSAATATYPAALFAPDCMAWGTLLIMLSEDRGQVSGDKG